LILSLVTGLAASAANDGNGRALHHYVHERWTNREGLPQNAILSSAQTPDGYLWFGTHEEVARWCAQQAGMPAKG